MNTAITTTKTAAAVIETKGLMAVNHLANEAGFLFNVTVTASLIDRVFGADGKHSVDEYLSLFLRTCAEQVKVAFSDNKRWERVRLFYPMPTLDGFFIPEEVLIKTDNADVLIMLASEEVLITQ